MRRLRDGRRRTGRNADEEDEMGDAERLHDVRAGDALLLTPEEAAQAPPSRAHDDLRPHQGGRAPADPHRPQLPDLARRARALRRPARRSPAAVPPRSRARRRTTMHQRGLFDLDSPAAGRRVKSTTRLPVSGPSDDTEPPAHEHRGVVDDGTRVERRVDDLQGRRRALARLRLRRLQAQRQASTAGTSPP